MDPAVTDELSKLDDGVAFRASPDHFHHTWARTFYSAPELYIRPESLEEIEKVTTLARRCRRRITTVGAGHSPSDLTCTSSWMVNLDKFNKILSVDRETGLVTMQAGIRLFQLSEELDKLGLAMPNLGSINEQSIAGAISTGTHGSTLLHSILSSSVTRLKITLSNSQTVTCSPDENEDLFRAALCSLGALGVITEITFLAVPAFSLHWKQTLYPHKHVIDTWNTNLWTQGEFVRVWWYPYTRRATIWHASKTTQPALDLVHKAASFDSAFGYHVYHNLLYIAQWVPRILPWVEWFITGMQFGFSAGEQTTIEAIQPSRQALLMDCLYSQTVNEWAIPLRNGPAALRRLTSWLNRLPPTDPEYVEHGIPYSAEGLWVHAPIEVRVSNTTLKLENNDGSSRKSVRPHLDTSAKDGPTLYLNATLYRPYNMDPPCLARYYQAFEYLMRDLDGKPHWAKNFETTNEELKGMYGDDLKSWLNVRNEADPEGMFVGAWHREHILGDDQPRFALEEAEVDRKPMRKGGVEIFGELASKTAQKERDEASEPPIAVSENVSSYSSQSSFDLLNSSEATESQHLPNSSSNGTKGKGLAEAMEEVSLNSGATEAVTPAATIATLNSSISSIEAVLRDLADSQTVTSENTASSTPDGSFQKKPEEITSASEEAAATEEAALVAEFWAGAAAAKQEAARKAEAVAKEQAAKEQAAKEQAAKEQAAKEQAAKEQAAKEEAARKEQAAKEEAARKEQAAKEEAARKEQAAKKQAAKEEAAKEEAARKEQAAKEQAAKEEAAQKEQAAKEEAARKEQAAKDQAAKEEAARKEQAAKDQAAKEQAAREQAAKEQAAKEQAAKEQAAKEQAAKEKAAQEKAAKEEADRKAKEQAEKEEAARKEQAAKEEAARKEQAAKEQAIKEQAAKEQAAKEQAAKEQAAKEEAARKAEAAAMEQAARKAAEDQAAKEQAVKEQAAKEEATRKAEAAVKEQAAKEHAAKEQAAKEEAARKAEAAAKEQAAKEQAAKQAAKEKTVKEKAAKDQAAKEQAAAKKEAAAKGSAAAKQTATAKKSAKDAEQTATAQQAQQNGDAQSGHISFAKTASPSLKASKAAEPNGESTKAVESTKDAEEKTTTTKARRLSFAKVAALTTKEAPKSTEPAAPVLDLHHLPPSPPKANGNGRQFLPLQSPPNGAHAKSKASTKEGGESPKAAVKKEQKQTTTTDATASPKQAKKEQQTTTTTDAAPPSKREAFDRSASTRAAKRAKLAELAEQFAHVEAVEVTQQKENVAPAPVARPNSLDDMLEEQARARGEGKVEGGWRPQARPNLSDELVGGEKGKVGK